MVTDTPAVPASPAPVPDAVRQVDNIDDQFFALIYSDEELLRQEFSEMIAAAWSSPPPPFAARGKGAERPPDRPRPHLHPIPGPCRAGVVTKVRRRGVRTRSPPKVTGRQLVPTDDERRAAPLSNSPNMPTGHEPGGWVVSRIRPFTVERLT